MQRFVNNWSATLQAPLFSADLEMQLPSALAGLLLLGSGDYYDLTVDPQGAAPEIIRATGVAGGVVTLGARELEGTAAPASWPVGTVVRCTATAGFLEEMQQQGGGSTARDVLVIPLGPLSVPASTGMLVGGGYSTDSSQVTLPVPADGQMLAIDLLLYQTATNPGDPLYELALQIPGGTVGDVILPSVTVESLDDTLTISDITTNTFCRLLISTINGGVYLDVVAYGAPPAAPA